MRTLALVLTALTVLAAGQAAAQPAARGHLVVIGGGTRPPEVMQKIAALAGGAKGRMLIFPHASGVPETGPDLEKEFRALGLGTVVLITADRTLYRNGAVIAGTSAGAAVMSRVMITGDEARPLTKDEAWQTIESENVATAPGLGFIDDVILDQHFVRRRRFNRLLSLVLEQPSLLGVAIDEETATWVKPDRTFEVIGHGPVLVVDASSGTAAKDAVAHGLRGENLRLHVLRAGSHYDLKARRVLRLVP